jgi:hypothetical protein
VSTGTAPPVLMMAGQKGNDMSNTKFTVQNLLNGMVNAAPNAEIIVYEFCADTPKLVYNGRFDKCPEEVYTRIVKDFLICEIVDFKVNLLSIGVYRDNDLY